MSQDSDRIVATRAGAAVQRSHGIRHNGSYSNGEHQHGCAILLWHLFPERFTELIAYVLFHDQGEYVFGDIPAPTMKYAAGLREITSELEGMVCEANGLPREDSLTSEQLAVVKACDRLDLYLWCIDQHLAGNRFVDSGCLIEIERYLVEVGLPTDRSQRFFDDVRAGGLYDYRMMLPVQHGVAERIAGQMDRSKIIKRLIAALEKEEAK